MPVPLQFHLFSGRKVLIVADDKSLFRTTPNVNYPLARRFTAPVAEKYLKDKEMKVTLIVVYVCAVSFSLYLQVEVTPTAARGRTRLTKV
jgi:hypothetical protein